MKNVIFVIEDLTNEQINTVIKKLEAGKKNKSLQKPGLKNIQLTKEEKVLVTKLEKLVKQKCISNNKYIEKDYINDIYCFFDSSLEEMKFNVNTALDDVINQNYQILDNIKYEKQCIKSNKANIIRYKKEKLDIQNGYKILDKLGRIFGKRTKSNETKKAKIKQ